jgi:hypothetical protein
MAHPTEITIIVKDDSTKLQEKHLMYDEVRFSHDCEQLKDLVNAAIQKFTGDRLQADVTIKSRMTW